MLFENVGQILFDLLQKPAILLQKLCEAIRYRTPGIRIDIAKSQFLQFLAHVLHTHAASQRRIDIHRFLGDPQTLVFAHDAERAHIVQTVGELDQKHADIFGNGQEKLAQVFGLHGLLGNEIQLLELGQAFDQLADLRPEKLIDLLAGGGGILDRVVQKRDGYRRFVQMHVCENGGDFERMGKIGVAGRAFLTAMFLHGIDICLVEKRLIHVRLVSLHTLNKLILAHHLQELPSKA